MKIQWVWIAIIIAVILVLVQLLSGYAVAQGSQGLPLLPLLLLLLMNEFGFVLCAIGGWTAANTLKKTGMQTGLAAGIVLCGAFAVWFIWNLISLYPGGSPG